MVTGPAGSGKSKLLALAGAYEGWRCRVYDARVDGADFTPPAHPQEFELVAIDHIVGAQPDTARALVGWCVENQVSLLLAEQTRMDIELILGALDADELFLSGHHEDDGEAVFRGYDSRLVRAPKSRFEAVFFGEATCTC